MDCTNLHTAAEVLEAFRACNDAGEEIELFECLATRPDPPVEALVELLRSVKLEPVLALTIQAFGKITNADIKARLKQSDDLLEMLSRQAQSGSTDLIRWAAATTIEEVGFDFIAVSQYLSQEPKKIAAKINELKLKRLADTDLINSSDYDEFIRFWAYGPIYALRGETLKVQNKNDYRVILDVIHTQQLWGIKYIRENLQSAEIFSVRRESLAPGVSYADFMDKIIEIYENELFEAAGQYLSARWLTQLDQIIESNRDSVFELLMEVQFHCLQSNNSKTRQQAALTILEVSRSDSRASSIWFYNDNLSPEKAVLGLSVMMFSNDFKSINYGYKDLCNISQDLEILEQKLSRNKVAQDCHDWRLLVLNEIQRRLKIFEKSKSKSLIKRNQVEKALDKIREIDSQGYQQVFSSFSLPSFPSLDLDESENDYNQLLQQHDNSLIKISQKYCKQWNSYYDSLIAPVLYRLKNAEEVRSNISNNLARLNYPRMGCFLFFFIFYMSFIYLGIWIIRLIKEQQLEPAKQKCLEISEEIKQLEVPREKVNNILCKLIQELQN